MDKDLGQIFEEHLKEVFPKMEHNDFTPELPERFGISECHKHYQAIVIFESLLREYLVCSIDSKKN